MRNLKSIIVAGAVAGGVAAVAFGGSAVATSFTSQSTGGTFNAATATAGVVANGSVNLGDAVPGDLGPSSPITVTNNGSNTESLTAALSGGNATLNPYVDVYDGTTDLGNLAYLESAGNIPLGNLAANATLGPVGLSLGLSPTTPNSDQGMSTNVSYTVTATATSATGNTGGGDTSTDNGSSSNAG